MTLGSRPPTTATAATTTSASAAQVIDAVPRSSISRAPMRPPSAMEPEIAVMMTDWATSPAALMTPAMNRLGELPPAGAGSRE
jgi:hypothetical protein